MESQNGSKTNLRTKNYTIFVPSDLSLKLEDWVKKLYISGVVWKKTAYSLAILTTCKWKFLFSSLRSTSAELVDRFFLPYIRLFHIEELFLVSMYTLGWYYSKSTCCLLSEVCFLYNQPLLCSVYFCKLKSNCVSWNVKSYIKTQIAMLVQWAVSSGFKQQDEMISLGFCLVTKYPLVISVSI